MADAVQIFDAGWQMPIRPSTGLPYTDGIISFFEAGTTTPLEVFSDAELTVSLGTSVSCDSSGYPVSSGNAKVLIYVGVDPYKIRISSTIAGGVLFEADEVRGATDTSAFITSAAVANKSIVAEPANRNIGASDKGKLIDFNPTAGTLSGTVAAAATLGDGWWVGVRHNGTANQVRIGGNGIDLFGINGASHTSFALTGRGQVKYIVCDGTGFRVDGEVDALIGGTTGNIVIADRLSAPPGSPLPGARYILTTAPSGAWSAFAEHDVAEWSGYSWFRYTPAADAGWIAYVQDEDMYYVFAGTGWRDVFGLIGSLSDESDPNLTTVQIPYRSSADGSTRRVTASTIIAYEHIQTQVASASATLDFALPTTEGFTHFEFILSGVVPGTDNSELNIRVSTDNAATYNAGATDYAYGLGLAGNPAGTEIASNGATAIQIGNALGTAAGEFLSGKVRLYDPFNASIRKFFEIATQDFSSNSGEMVNLTGGGGFRANNTALTHVRFIMSAGTIASGNFSMYGIRAS